MCVCVCVCQNKELSGATMECSTCQWVSHSGVLSGVGSEQRCVVLHCFTGSTPPPPPPPPPPLLKVSLCNCSWGKGSSTSSATSSSQAANLSSACELVMPLAGVRPARRQYTVLARLRLQLHPPPPSRLAPLTPSPSTGLCPLDRLPSHPSAWKWMTLTLWALPPNLVL